MSIPRKLVPGDTLDFSARTHNDAVDTVGDLRTRQQTMQQGDLPDNLLIRGNLVKGMNSTGAGVPWYGVVRLTTPRAYHGGAVDEANFQNRVYLNAQLSEGELDETIGIAQHTVPGLPGPEYAIGDFLIDGVTQCRIKYSKEEEEEIGWATGESEAVDYLVPNINGQVEILWHEPMTWGSAAAQTVWALVRLTATFDEKPTFVHFELKYDLTYDSLTGTDAYILTWDEENGQWDTPEEEDDVIKVIDPNVDDDTPLRGCAGESELEVLDRGVRGVAEFKNGIYEIVQLFHKARFIEFYLDEALAITDEHKTAIIMVRGAKRMFWDGIDPDPAGDGFEVYNALLDDGGEYLFEGEKGDKGYAVYDEHDDKYWIVLMKQEDRDHWAKAQSDWDENGAACAKVEVKPCDADGTVEDDPVPSSFDVFLPRNRTKIKGDDYDPDVYTLDIILWRYTEDGTRVCASTYLRSKIGDLRWQDDTARIQTGWQLCNGAAATVNALDSPEAKDIRGRALIMYDDDDTAGDASENAVAKSLGFRWHGADGPDEADNNHPDHERMSVGAPDQLSGVGYANTPSIDSNGDTTTIGWGEYLESEADVGKPDAFKHLGPFNENEEDPAVGQDTDNRAPRYTAALIRRYK